MQLITLQKRAVILALFFYILSLSYPFIDPTGQINELNIVIDKFSVPLFGDLNLWLAGISAFLGLGLYFIFYFLAYRNSFKAFYFFIAATFFIFITLVSDMGPQLNSGVISILETFGCIFDGMIIGCLLLGRVNEK